MNLTTGTTARSYVNAWLQANCDRLGWTQVATEVAEEPAAFLGATYRSVRYLINFSVWDHASCLDILVLNASTGEQLYSAGGSCEDMRGLSERLSVFDRWYAEAKDAA